MKRYIKLLSFALFLVFAIGITSSCSSKTPSAFEMTDLSYKYSKSFDSINNIIEESLGDYLETFFSSKAKSGFLAIIKPADVKYYHTYSADNQGELTCEGFALYDCSVESISSDYNTSNFDHRTITVRMNICLQPNNEEVLKILADRIGLNDNGSYKLGTYVVPNQLINRTDYSAIINQHTITLSNNYDYYAFIENDGTNNWLVALCPVDENAYKTFSNDTSLPNEVINNMKCIKDFVSNSDLKPNN